MEYLSKKQSWLDFINESMGNNMKDTGNDSNNVRKESTETDNINYSIFDSDSESFHNTNNSGVDLFVSRIPSLEKLNNKNKNQQQNVVANRKYMFFFVDVHSDRKRLVIIYYSNFFFSCSSFFHTPFCLVYISRHRSCYYYLATQYTRQRTR